MKLVTFEAGGEHRLGAVCDEHLVDLATAYKVLSSVRGEQSGVLRALPSDMTSFIRLGRLAFDAAERTIQFMRKRPAVPVGARLVYPFDAVTIHAPISRPGKILCAGIDDRGRIEKCRNAATADEPLIFCKLPSTVIGPGASIIQPRAAENLGFEAALAAVIGKKIRAVSEEQATNAIFGFTILNDVSVRDARFNDRQVTLGRNFDTFSPMGPWIVTADELRDPSSVRWRAFLNGMLVQEGTAADLFPLPRLVSFLSNMMTLEPGDIISVSVAAWTESFRTPPLSPRPGNRVTFEIEGIGRLENPVIAEH